MKEVLVSIITVNYRQAEATLAFLESLNNQSFRNYEVILVDNAPHLNYSDSFAAICPYLKLIINAENIGFAAANNQGMSLAEGKFFFLLNNDTIVTDGFFEACLLAFEDPEVGAISPLICYDQSGERIQYAGFTALDWRGRNQLIGQNQIDQGQFSTERETPYLHGAAMIVRQSVWEQIGGMSEDFFLYYEELAWSESIRAAGYRIKMVPQARIYHKASLSTGQGSPLKLYYLTRNRLLFMCRYSKLYVLPFFHLYFFGLVVPSRVFYLWRSGQKIHLHAFVQAMQDWFCGRLGHQKIIGL
ncbi:glycosyltransferase family 2 protein [Haliscomenobacter sp.]|uniref:glycosyltransferase family 2 protein n=1 Tax=Haliscomenobacter sp. TaxID=2717303 RepID=UPI003593F3A3